MVVQPPEPHPFRKVATLLPSFCCSVAILKYLAQKHPAAVADHWYPADLQRQARVNEYLSWQHMNVRSHGSKVFLLRVSPPHQHLPAPLQPEKGGGTRQHRGDQSCS